MINLIDRIKTHTGIRRISQVLGVAVLLLMSAYFVLVRGAWRVRGETTLAGQDASLWYSPQELDFGEVGIDTLSDQKVITITNAGTTVINFAGGAAPDPFSATQNCAGGLNPGASCQFFYRFAPASTGEFSTTTGPSSTAGPIQVTLHGKGVGPDLTYSPRALDFGRVLVGDVSPNQAVKITNTGLAALGFAGGAAPDPFSATQNCGAGIAPGESCQFFYNFSPTASGLFTTTTGPASNASKAIQIDLSGRGYTGPFVPVYNFTVSPLELDFGPVGAGTASAPQQVTIYNRSPSETLTDFAGGGVPAPFSGAQNCAGGVPPGGNCQYTFYFSPTATGVFSATSNSSTNMGPFTILLHGSGEGAKISVSPLSLDFGPVPLGATSPPQAVTIKNVGLSTLANFAGGGVPAPFSAYQNCAGGVAPGDSCQYTFYFSPTEAGHYEATSNSSTNAGAFTIQLSGGMSPPQGAQQFIPALIPPGASSSLQLAIANPNPTLALTNVAVSNLFPSGLEVATPAVYSVSPECGSPGFNPTPGAASFSFAGGTISGGDTCLIQVEVSAAQAGTYVNTTDAVEAADPAGKGNAPTATLSVGYRQYMPFVQK